MDDDADSVDDSFYDDDDDEGHNDCDGSGDGGEDEDEDEEEKDDIFNSMKFNLIERQIQR